MHKNSGQMIELFQLNPNQWGLRGDPFLWEDLKNYFLDKELPKTKVALESLIRQTFKEFVSEDIDSGKMVYIEKYSQGGMSSGQIDCNFWLKKLLPLFLERYSQISQNIDKARNTKIDVNLVNKYFDFSYKKRIHEYSKIDSIKNWDEGQAKLKYQKIDDFYKEELQIDSVKLNELRIYFQKYNVLYNKYRKNNIAREGLFSDYNKLLEWYNDQQESCNYCGISQSNLTKIVESRKGNLTLNQKIKRSKGSLEIEKLNPLKGYTFDNSVLSCPLCNNAKSNLISEEDWRKYFAPAMKRYFNSILSDIKDL